MHIHFWREAINAWLRRSKPGYLLEMVGISKEFPGVKALDDVTLQVQAGHGACADG